VYYAFDQNLATPVAMGGNYSATYDVTDYSTFTIPNGLLHVRFYTSNTPSNNTIVQEIQQVVQGSAGGTPSFASLTGNPSDNAALQGVLDLKQNKTEFGLFRGIGEIDNDTGFIDLNGDTRTTLYCFDCNTAAYDIITGQYEATNNQTGYSLVLLESLLHCVISTSNDYSNRAA
jgi:hypothetical protein